MGAELTDDEIAAMRTMIDVPGPYVPGPEKPRVGDWAGNWLRGHGDGYELADETDPAAIAAGQRADVAAALADLGPGATDEQVSTATVLPLWTVRRRRAELGGGA